MIAELKPYPEYKESGVSWLGKVPRHWSSKPNRALFAEVNDRGHAGDEMLSVTIAKGIIRQKALLTGTSKKDSSRSDKFAYKLVQPADIAYNKMRAWQGAIGVSELRGIISPAYVVMRLRGEINNPRYFHHLYRTPHFAKEAERWSYGITSDMWSLRPEHFRMIYSPLPSPTEQAAIVRFLDWANGRLERAIRAKRKVIALLNEQKQAIIHRAVTRGLDPHVPLKPSGTDGITTGQQFSRVVAGCHGFHFENDTPNSKEDVLLLGNLAQSVEDIVDIWDSLEAKQRIEYEYDLNVQMQEISEAGFLVFGCRRREQRKLLREIETWNITYVLAMRKTNPRVKRKSEELEELVQSPESTRDDFTNFMFISVEA